MDVDAPAGGDTHMEIEEPAAQGEPAAQADGPAARGEPELLIVVSPTVTTAGQQADPAGSAAGQGQPGEPVVLEEDAATAAGQEQRQEPPQGEPAAQTDGPAARLGPQVQTRGKKGKHWSTTRFGNTHGVTGGFSFRERVGTTKEWNSEQRPRDT